MNWLDIVLAIPLLWFTYKGFKNGFIIELASLAALVLGIFAALHFSFYTKEYLSENFEISDTYLSLISFAITFVVVVIVVYLVGKIIHKLVNIVALGFLNKLAGGLFGFVKTALVLSVIIYFINVFDHDSRLLKPDVKENSRLYPHIESIVPMLLPMLDMKEYDEKDIGNTDII